MQSLLSAFDYFFAVLSSVTVNDILDMGLLCILLYYILKFVRDTRAMQLTKGIILLVVLLQVTSFFRLSTTHYLLRNSLQFGVLALIVVFQPELRTLLERVGRGAATKPFKSLDNASDSSQTSDMLEHVQTAVINLSSTKTGAIIVLEQDTKLGEYIETGTMLDAALSSHLIENIFFPKSPMHDGAMILRNGRVAAAGCYLPLSQNPDISAALGTRHRAAIGLSEVSDAIIIVVSEETSVVSIAYGGMLERNIHANKISNVINEYIRSDTGNALSKSMAYRIRRKLFSRKGDSK